MQVILQLMPQRHNDNRVNLSEGQRNKARKNKGVPICISVLILLRVGIVGASQKKLEALKCRPFNLNRYPSLLTPN